MNDEQVEKLINAVKIFLDNVDITKLKRHYKPRQKNPQTKFPFAVKPVKKT